MTQFGDSTNSHREELVTQEAHHRSSNVISDDLKNHYQFSEAIVISRAEITDADIKSNTLLDSGASFKYVVLLIREQIEIEASHKPDNSFWSKTSYPKGGDLVRIKHKKDFFRAEIVDKLDASLEAAMAKYGTITKKAG